MDNQYLAIYSFYSDWPQRIGGPLKPMAGVRIKFRDEPARPDSCIRRSWAGFTIESVRINQARAFDYDWQGSSHYLAVHDIVLSDGEVAVGEVERANCANLRDRLTFVPKNARVSGWSALAGDDHGYTAIFFDPDLAEAEYERPLVGLSVRPLLYFEDMRLCQTLRRLEALATSDGDAESVAAETLGLLAVLQLHPWLGCAFRPAAGHLTLAQQRQLTEFIDAKIASSISLSDMAAVAGLSRYHFARSFSRTYGRAPHQHLLLRRISLAASLLAGSSLPIGEIAHRAGFSSPARLSIAFRRIIGRSPTAFRQAVR